MNQTHKFKLYLIGSLRNPKIPEVHKLIETMNPNIEVFSGWFSAGPDADDKWRDYEKSLGYSFTEALKRPSAVNVFEFDKRHLLASDGALLVAPAGKSGHLELGWVARSGQWTGILLDNPDRWDVMMSFIDVVSDDLKTIVESIECRRVK